MVVSQSKSKRMTTPGSRHFYGGWVLIVVLGHLAPVRMRNIFARKKQYCYAAQADRALSRPLPNYLR